MIPTVGPTPMEAHRSLVKMGIKACKIPGILKEMKIKVIKGNYNIQSKFVADLNAVGNNPPAIDGNGNDAQNEIEPDELFQSQVEDTSDEEHEVPQDPVQAAVEVLDSLTL